MTCQLEIIRGILNDPKTNIINVDYTNRALDGLSAWVRQETGKTVDSVKRSMFMADRFTSSRSPSLLLTMARDMGSRNSDDEFDFRSLCIARLHPETLKPIQNVGQFLHCRNFEKGWVATKLTGMPIFPGLETSEEEANFVTLFFGLRRLEAQKELLSKTMKKLKDRLKKNKPGPGNPIVQMGHEFFYQPPTGTSQRIVDSNGTPIKQSPGNASLCLRLELANPPAPVIEDFDNDDIVKLHLTIEEVSDKIKKLQTDLRPFELGFIERFDGDVSKPLKIQGIDFTINNKPGKPSYSYTDEDRQKVESGEYKFADVPVSKGKWVCKPVSVPLSQEVEETEEVEATV